MKPKTHFGFKQVNIEDKQKLVSNVFDSVADRYDIMNDIMSFGLHRLWKERLMLELKPCEDCVLLDVASGTLDIALKFMKNGGNSAIASDINPNMLENGRKKLLESRFADSIRLECADAQQLPFEDNSFDYYTISFGIRNVPDINKALHEAYRVLVPGGKLICLEFSNVNNSMIRKLYKYYNFNIIPKVGKIVANDEAAYRYLAESIAKFPKAEEFSHMIMDAGFEEVSYTKLTFGVVALHIGYKV